MIRPDRHVGAAGGQHPEHGHDLVAALGQAHGDRIAGLQAPGGERTRVRDIAMDD